MDQFKLLLDKVSALFKTSGFTKSGNTFYLSHDKNWGLINFQKSLGTTTDLTKFTINIGVYSGALNGIIGTRNIKTGKPTMADCHWKKRIGELMAVRSDYWWQIDSLTSIAALSEEILPLISEAITEIKSHINDHDLETEWLDGISPGIIEFSRYKFLTTILKRNNKGNYKVIAEEFKKYVRGKPIEDIVLAHLSEIENS